MSSFRRNTSPSRLWVTAAAAGAWLALASSAEGQTFDEGTSAATTSELAEERVPAQGERTSLRGVVSARTDLAGTYLCGDYAFRPRWAFVGCGTGAGFLHPGHAVEGAGEVMHLRVDWTAWSSSYVSILLGVGIAEVEFAEDRTGLVFAPSSDTPSLEAAGTEVAVGFDVPLRTAWSTLRLRLDSGLAWIPGLPEIGGTSAWMPFGVFTANALF